MRALTRGAPKCATERARRWPRSAGHARPESSSRRSVWASWFGVTAGPKPRPGGMTTTPTTELVATRESLHRVASSCSAATRRRATGQITFLARPDRLRDACRFPTARSSRSSGPSWWCPLGRVAEGARADHGRRGGGFRGCASRHPVDEAHACDPICPGRPVAPRRWDGGRDRSLVRHRPGRLPAFAAKLAAEHPSPAGLPRALRPRHRSGRRQLRLLTGTTPTSPCPTPTSARTTGQLTTFPSGTPGSAPGTTSPSAPQALDFLREGHDVLDV